MNVTKSTILASTVALAMLPMIVPVQAGNLPARDCLALSREKDALAAKGAQGHMDKGPAWATANNLSQAKIANIKRLITVKEQLMFRCDMRQLAVMRKKLSSPKFARWRKLNPPLPIRNPKFKTLAKN